MSETTAEATETAAEGTKEQQGKSENELPADHPLVKTLAAQKTEIKELRAKSKRLDDIDEAAKTQAQKDADRVAAAEAEVATVPAKVADALRTHLVALHQIDMDDAELFLTATEPELLLKQVTRLLGQSDKRQRKNHVPREGENPSAASNDEAAFARSLFGG